MAKKKYSDGYMLTLWRKAVKVKYGAKCFLCGYRDGLEVHHIRPRSGRLLRYAPENGIPLCKECHRTAHTDRGKAQIREQLDREIVEDLDFFEGKTLKDFLPEIDMTKDEYYMERAEELKHIIASNKEGW